MSTNFNLFFYLKEPKRYKSGPVPVYLRITIDCQRSEIAVGRDIEPNLWDLEKRRAKGTKEAARQLNNHLDTIQSKVKEVHTQMIATGDEITARNLKDNYLGINAQSRMLVEIFLEHNVEMESLIGNGFSDNTLRTFKSSLKHITEYLQVKYKVSDISIRKVDQAFIKNYDTFLRTKHHKCTPISADKYVKHLKKIILLSLGNRWITENPFMHYKSTAKPTPRTFLTNDELSVIIKKKFAVERLKQVRDIFIFCCYTGLAYVDVQKLNPNEIGIGDDGKRWIFTNRHKTNTPVHLPLLPEAQDIIEQYKHHPVCVCKSIVLPVFTNRRKQHKFYNMKNPFEKEDHTGLIVGIAVGVTAGIGLGWLFLTDKGAQYRRQITRKLKEGISDTAAEVVDNKTIIPKKAAKVATDAVIKD
ncbi:MAG: Recombinase [Mucilaginibacter sp.]|nr:Recombinase [Mucilaginibacter sp.]